MAMRILDKVRDERGERELLDTRLDLSKLPSHVAIIMDGNGRWAASRSLPRIAGHRAGADAVRRIGTPPFFLTLAGHVSAAPRPSRTTRQRSSAIRWTRSMNSYRLSI